MKMEWWTVLSVLCLLSSIQAGRPTIHLDMMLNTFDDQYIGCVDKMETEMAKVLVEELKDVQFGETWAKASQAWKDLISKGLVVPGTFLENYGIAVVLYTMNEPYYLYKQLNKNISIAGQSRDIYMQNFRFKALHFYLTRALQVLRTGCGNKTQVYRGAMLGPVTVANQMRFDRFASSTRSISIAKDFGEDPFFNITTCYGVDIDALSEFEEQEFLIPVGETFKLIRQKGATYELESTGLLCSYFNCAYLGDEKKTIPFCSSDEKKTIHFCSSDEKKTISSSGVAGFLYSYSSSLLIIHGLTVTLNLLLVTIF